MTLRLSPWVLAATVALAVLSTSPGRARADARVMALDGRAWPDVVAALQSDVTSQGTAVALCLRDDASGTCAPCGTYFLAFDGAGAQAITLGACDEATGASTVTLVDRSALFDHTHAVPRPRTLTVRAAIVSAIETTGGAASTGGTALACVAHVRPYLRDLEHGVDVFLGPDLHDVRLARPEVGAIAMGNGWMLASEGPIDGGVDYGVVERSSGEVVMTGHASLACPSESLTAVDVLGTVDPPGTYAGLADAREDFASGPLVGVAGGTVPGSSLAPGCIGSFPARPQHVLSFTSDLGSIRLHADGGGSADLTLAVLDGEGRWHCNDDGHEAPHPLDPVVTVPAHGVLEVWVGTYGAASASGYRLEVGAMHVVHSSRPEPNLLAAGVLMQTFAWAFLTAFDAFPEVLCTRDADCPNATWRSAAWIPLIGPWIAESLDGARGSTFSMPAIADVVIQDVGLLFALIAAALGQDREVPSYALGEGEGAPRVSLHGGAGSAVGVTLVY